MFFERFIFSLEHLFKILFNAKEWKKIIFSNCKFYVYGGVKFTKAKYSKIEWIDFKNWEYDELIFGNHRPISVLVEALTKTSTITEWLRTISINSYKRINIDN